MENFPPKMDGEMMVNKPYEQMDDLGGKLPLFLGGNPHVGSSFQVVEQDLGVSVLPDDAVGTSVFPQSVHSVGKPSPLGRFHVGFPRS